MAVKPRERPPAKVEHEPSEKACRWLERHRDAYIKYLEERRVEFGDTDFKIDRMLPCIKKRLEIGAPEGMRNRFSWQLASYFCKKGVPLNECLNIMQKWHAKLDPGINEAYTWKECETTIRKTYDAGGYAIGCGSEYVGGDPEKDVESLCVGTRAKTAPSL